MSTRSEEIQHCRVFSPDHILLPDISYTSFVYPGDQEALAALSHVPGAPTLLTYLQKNITEGVIFVENNQQMIRANEHCFASLHKLVTRCCEILSCPLPDVYVTNNPFMNAYTSGHRRTCLVLHSSLIEAMTADELSFVIGHELGHIKCGHGLYRQLGDILIQYASFIPIPGIDLIRVPLLLAFWEWYRRAELTCDRAGLLCLQASQPALTALGKLAGKVAGFEDEFDIESAIAQSEADKEVSKFVALVSVLNNAENTHPFVPARLKQVREYSESADYKKILHGEYERDALGIHEGGIRVTCQCGAEVNAKLRFCPACGREVHVESAAEPFVTSSACKVCGHVFTVPVNFCPSCGAKQEPTTMLGKLKSKTPGFFKRH